MPLLFWIMCLSVHSVCTVNPLSINMIFVFNFANLAGQAKGDETWYVVEGTQRSSWHA